MIITDEMETQRVYHFCRMEIGDCKTRGQKDSNIQHGIQVSAPTNG